MERTFKTQGVIKILKKIGGFLNGKKTYIGLGMHTAWFVVNLILKEMATPLESGIGHTLIGGWTGYGIGDKIAKNKKVINDTIDKAKKIITPKNK